MVNKVHKPPPPKEASQAENSKDVTHPSEIIIGMQNNKIAAEIKTHLQYFGYQSLLTQDVEKICQKAIHPIHQKNLAAIILDLEMSQKTDPKVLKKHLKNIPLLFISKTNDTPTQLFAIRAGGNAFFTIPFEFSQLIETIEHLTSPQEKEGPERILIIENSPVQANFMKKILEEAGMMVHITADPMKINEELKAFRPEIILMDFYLSDCNGSELARAIRQQGAYVSLPIVFLSAKEHTIQALDAMRLGGDEFFTKPIHPENLIKAIITRVKRYRALQKEMSQDDLTGLLNHTRILEQLALELNRAKRNQTALSFAMIDIDNFKKINDAYGHPIGDRVIKSLAQFFKQRLRKTDTIGRYGGEEFAIIFPQSDANNVFNVLNDIRKQFSMLKHQGSTLKQDFTVTFSAGISSFDVQNQTVDTLVETADKALYTAKHKGRNQVIMSPEPSNPNNPDIHPQSASKEILAPHKDDAL